MRLWVHTVPLGRVNSDEAISGLIALEVTQGRFRTFFWGQNYGGTLESIATATLMKLSGSNTFSFASIPILESICVSLLVYRVSKFRLDPQSAALAAALSWVFPASAVLFSTRSMLFYQPTLILGLLAVWATELLVRSETDRPIAWFVLGFALGVGLWCSVQVAFFAVPVAVILLFNRRDYLKGWAAAAVGGALGASPWLIYFVRNNGSSVTKLANGYGSYFDHLLVILTRGLPIALGAREPNSERWLPRTGFGFIVIVLMVYGLISCIRRPERRSPLVFVLVAFIPLQALAPGAFYAGSGRYYIYLAPTVAFVVAATVHRKIWLATVVVAALAASTTTLWGIRDVEMAPDATRPVATFLIEQGIHHIYAHFWVAYKLAWEADGEIIVASDYERNPQWTREVRSASDAAYVMFLPIPQDRIRFERLISGLRNQSIAYREHAVGDYIIIIPDLNSAPAQFGMGG